MKLIKICAIVCAVALLVSGCSWVQITRPNSASTIDATKYLEQFYQNWQYQQLTETEQFYYGMIYTSVIDSLSTETTVQDANGQQIPGLRISFDNSQLSKEQISRLFEAFYLDNPSFFFLDRTCSLEGREINETQVYDTLVLQYTMTADERIEAGKQLDAAKQNILKDCPSTDDDFLVELYLHDQLLSICSYDDDAAFSSAQYPNAYSAYGALVEGRAVCEGYAKAMQLLLNTLSIPAALVRGYSAENQTAHMWNVVEINDQNYFLDPTWNDNDQQIHYAYFNITSAELKRSHIVDSGNFIKVDCAADADNYYVRNHAQITVYDRDAIASAIAAQIQAGNSAVHLRFDEGKFENGLLFLKNASLTKRMVNAYLKGDQTMWDYTLSIHSAQNTLTLYKSS